MPTRLRNNFNDFITERLAGGAWDTLRRHGVEDDHITQILVPGAWEIPQVAMRVAKSGSYDAVICLGAVIRGGTPHLITSQPKRRKVSVKQAWNRVFQWFLGC